MSNLTIKENQLVEDVELRKKYLDRTEVLDEVRGLILLPDSELVLMKMVAEYYGAKYDTIKKLVQRNEDELKSNGMRFLSYKELKEYFAGDTESPPQLSTKGSNVFSKRALLNVGMLLENSDVAPRSSQSNIEWI